MQTVVIIQARMGSTRLPGKILKDIGGRTMLACVVHRTKQAAQPDEVVVATSIKEADEAVAAECEKLGVPVFRGSEEDVLDRYYRAARAHNAGAVVRITSDCPLIDSAIIDKVVRAFRDKDVDYASNSLKRTYPRGLDTEVITITALERAWMEAKKPYERVHVTPFIRQNPILFDLLSVTGEKDYSKLRWTVDMQEDLEFVRAVYDRMGDRDDFSWKDVLTLLKKEPELVEINRHVQQKSLEEG